MNAWKEVMVTYVKLLFYQALNKEEEIANLFGAVAKTTSPYYNLYLKLFGKEICEETTATESPWRWEDRKIGTDLYS